MMNHLGENENVVESNELVRTNFSNENFLFGFGLHINFWTTADVAEWLRR